MAKTRINLTATVLVFMTLLVIKPTGALSQYKWEKLEEFKINSLYNVEIIDYHPKEKLYLGYINTAKGTQIALIDENGEFAAKEMLTGEGPNQSASAINSMAFAEDGNIWLQAAVQLLLSDRDFVIKKNSLSIELKDKYLRSNGSFPIFLPGRVVF